MIHLIPNKYPIMLKKAGSYQRPKHQIHSPGTPPWGGQFVRALGSDGKPQLARNQTPGRPMPALPTRPPGSWGAPVFNILINFENGLKN